MALAADGVTVSRTQVWLDSPIKAIGRQKVTIAVHPDDPASTVAETIEKYNLPAVPVVDGEGSLVGMITVDDVLTEVLPLAWQKKLRL